MARTKTATSKPVNGKRSGFEDTTAQVLTDHGVDFTYESIKLPYVQPAKQRTYKPDFVMMQLGWLLETKGILELDDRQKMCWVRDTYPELDIRFLFQNANRRIYPKSKTTYGMWATAEGFQWAHRKLPVEWLQEDPNTVSLAIIRGFFG